MALSQTICVLYLAAEADPFVKVGGLGDVAGSLPAALDSLNRSAQSIFPRSSDDHLGEIDIRLVLPYHGAIQEKYDQLQQVASFPVPYEDGPALAAVYEKEVNGLLVYFVGGLPFPPGLPVYTNDNLRDGYRYTFFSLAALELTRILDWRPDILHANDWHTAPAVYSLMLRRQKEKFFRKTASILTVHNLPYMGIGAGPALQGFGLPPATGSTLPWWAQDAPLPLGLWAADKIVAVSPSYAKEILTPEYGAGLDEFLRSRSGDIFGILNGIDTGRWNPLTDPGLTAHYSAGSLSERSKDRAALRSEFGFSGDFDTPILALIARFDPQKGVDLAIEALRMLTREPGAANWQALILGTGNPDLEAAVQHLESDLPERVKAVIRFDPDLSRRIYAGADMLLLPSRYEPCGLEQMIAMRYGCVPIARATGGLIDTIQDYDQPGLATGFLFQNATAGDLVEAIRRALAVYSDHQRWQALQINGMDRNFSWAKSAHQYASLYRTLIGNF